MPVPDDVQAIIDEIQAELNILAQEAANGDITAAQFISLFREDIKSAYVQNYLVGIGEREMTQSDYGTLSAMLRDEYKYLDGFAADLGNLSVDQIEARMGMYINGSRSAYYKAFGMEQFASGMDEERWICADDERSCEDCPKYAEMGWVPFGDLPEPGDGESACLTNCRCHKEFRSSQGVEENG